LNVGFGDVGNNGVTVAEAEYIDRGGRESLKLTPGNTLTYIIFSDNFQRDKLAI
jgi:hypothetical protein